MAITKLVRAEFDRAVQEELFDIKFIDFGEGLVTVFLQNTETCKNAYKSNHSVTGLAFSQVPSGIVNKENRAIG